MTIRQAAASGVRYLTLPGWTGTSHLELPLLSNGRLGPWATVRDPSGSEEVFISKLLNDPEGGYLAYDPPEPELI